MSEAAPSAAGEQQDSAASLQKIQTLLSAKDDTSRFVGLALLKSVLDNTPELRSNEDGIASLWDSIPQKFLDRLIRTGSKQQAKGTNDMLDLAVSVLHTFTALLPERSKQDSKLVSRIPQLVACLLYCSDDTARLVLEALVSLVNQPEGAKVFDTVDDLSTLTEIAPVQSLVLDTLFYAWLGVMATTADKRALSSKIDQTVGALVVSFRGTDGVTLLKFLGNLLPRLDPELLPPNPTWLPSLAKFVRDLVVSRPTADGRAAFANLSAALLEVYPIQAPQLLFADNVDTKSPTRSESPFAFLLVNLLLIDIRSTIPTLLEQLNSPSYSVTAQRLTSAYNIVSNFMGYLLRALEALDSGESSNNQWIMKPDLLLKLRTSISETMSLTAEYLRDRWDASIAGAMGLHPEARTGAANESGVSHFTLAWDSKSVHSSQDPLILAAIRTLAIWLREDDGEQLRKEAAGLSDMFVDLYQTSSSPEKGLDFKRPVLVAFEGILEERKGKEAFLENGGWLTLVDDLCNILQASSTISDENEAARGVEIVRNLLRVAEAEQPGTREDWMDLVTKAAAWAVPDQKQPPMVEECQVAVLQLATALLVNAHPGLRRRYTHSTSAIIGIATQLRDKVKKDRGLVEALSDVLETLAALRQ
ncbi:Neurochondrin-domain-containing protein [Triangularia setosa]|uniref:Neurochondrin-domain-containing protein n=1 Tax=Triangularia setosa TaxID=2587417 RepID=A0AAN6WDI9_9PEZI|nr:Neurochondrin-domain-containing protein [Podospora setosa]